MSGRELAAAVRSLEVTSGSFHLGPVSFELLPGEVLAVLGPNGSGKTTLLRALAGLEPVEGGSFELGGREITRAPPQRRGIGFVFQDLALFPQKTVEENVAYGLTVSGPWDDRKEARLQEMLQRFGLEALARRRPGELSGGERQRVALARALAPSPRLLLLDEPLAASDPRRRRELQVDLARWLREGSEAAVYVTHDLEEALLLGDRILLLWKGRVLRWAPPVDLLSDPQDVNAAWFLGYNVARDGKAWFGVHPWDLEPSLPKEGGTLSARLLRRVPAPWGERWLLSLGREEGSLPWEAWVPKDRLAPDLPKEGTVELRALRRVALEGSLEIDWLKSPEGSPPGPSGAT